MAIPMFSFFTISSSRTWDLEKGNPMHCEVGFLRAEPGTSKLAFMIAQNTGTQVYISFE